jgi:hypothetical protein
MFNSNIVKKPGKVLNKEERAELLLYYPYSQLVQISIDNWLPIYLCAKENDIIQLKDNNVDIYYLVVPRYPYI